jgi:Phage integrase, N-terminal SAM-like domain
MYRDLHERERSGGTYPSERVANRAWQRAEADMATGKIGDPKRGRQTLCHYVETRWFPHHVMQATTRENYRYILDRYVLPELGRMRMVDILPSHVRDFITILQRTYEARPPTIRQCKVVLDAI